MAIPFNKRVFAVMTLILVLLLAACSSSESSGGSDSSSGEKVKIAMITSEGGLGDRSYNDSGNEGLKKASDELGAEVKVVEPQDVSEGEKYLTQLAQSGFDLVITLDLGHEKVLKEIAPQYPDTQFAIFNTVVEGDNITSVLFHEHEGSFLAGALAALVTQDESVNNLNGEKVISFVGGVDSPGINKFLVGYEEGAKHIDPETKVIVGYSNSFSDPSKGKEITLSQIEQKADVIYQVAGATGEGVIDGAKTKDVFAIGVDSDQDYIAEGNVLTSVMKRVDVAVFELSKAAQGGSYESIIELGLKENGVQLSEMKFTKDMINPDHIAKVEEIKEQIINGEIEVTDVTKQ
ncbi:hypothetical protein WQ57_06065 [Mesobacillus campisalis]|uniref:ABC transporter substrate-binding protein PnrA-like domain-containing protein n=1 Tax=Mesobacillus campisalis TaxID=1408103 RepID=A0A0M2T102_9BACI|nr:BMP family ABC transporter substrate-binding protein [Mesobacillus campisalis]KKK38912.1 hypothetical protein WQ57_06065 [Mesobacillus campisalis]